VTGQDPLLWQGLRSKLVEVINGVLDSVIDHEKETTVREEAKKMTSALLDHAKARLAKAGLENEKIEAEIQRLYTQIENDYAEARKKHAEAEAIELNTALKKLWLSVGLTKAMLIGEAGEENIVFSQQIDAFLGTLKELEPK